ncbi:sulfotransferase family protein [Pontivivens insulae]|uniref:Uncharacterized protein n=1 Tax=Pontivivens insulae TaxID=1639689 RepID=A0A2R8A718_9RHOB|nr:sulfotransferase family protein [Pontivivens insulae]RED18137.1 hypothetical protein DFR53_0330 [Pontivivens insulae]SPF28034.1 hypothetical protein POI8812_00331 [Pontivivens insulae]
MKLAVWSGPRNLSTAMMRSFLGRDDCRAWDEPFYAAYLARTGVAHPMREHVLSAGITNGDEVAARLEGHSPAALWYLKHMVAHMIEDMPLGHMRDCTNIFLIREPARVIASFLAKRQTPEPWELGFSRLGELFDWEADRLGTAPVVVETGRVRADPEGQLRNLCTAVGIDFQPAMLSWPAGHHPDYGIWADHWYGSVLNSTDFAPPDRAELPEVPAHLLDPAQPIYDRLLQHAL